MIHIDHDSSCYIDCGINCLISEFNNVTTISSEILIDILFSMNVIKSLFSGLVFCISLNSKNVQVFLDNHIQGYFTAAKLLDFLLLYTEQGKKEYLSMILSNNALDKVVYALKTENPNAVVYLDEYKLRVLRLMRNLQQVHKNLFDCSVLNFLLPLLNAKNPVVVDMDLDLMYGNEGRINSRTSLIENDPSMILLTTAVNSNIIATIHTLTARRSGHDLVSEWCGL